MRAVFHIKQRLDHQARYGAAMKAGLKRHGITVEQAPPNEPRACDFAIMWGWKQPNVVKAVPHVLVMEGPHIRKGDPRNLDMASCGWDGLNGRARYPKAVDGARRWIKYYPYIMKKWTKRVSMHRYPKREGYALLIGQVDGDAALAGLYDFQRWAQHTCDELRSLDWGVVYRHHPFGNNWLPQGAHRARGTLAENLAGASLCVTYNSTAGVDAVLAGIPTVALDKGSMAWPVSGHSLSEIVCPKRESWAYDLAWASYTIEEIASGFAWEHLAPIMEESA